jgi:hypothetical protein
VTRQVLRGVVIGGAAVGADRHDGLDAVRSGADEEALAAAADELELAPRTKGEGLDDLELAGRGRTRGGADTRETMDEIEQPTGESSDGWRSWRRRGAHGGDGLSALQQLHPHVVLPSGVICYVY